MMNNIISHIKVKCLGGKPSYFLVPNFDWKVLTTVLFLEYAETFRIMLLSHYM